MTQPFWSTATFVVSPAPDADDSANLGTRVMSELRSHPEITDAQFSCTGPGRYELCGVFCEPDALEANAAAARVCAAVFSAALGRGETLAPLQVTSQPLEGAAAS